MNSISELLSLIQPPDEAARATAQFRWNSIAKPLGSLGLFEDALLRIAALRGTADISAFSNKALIVFCADNGVVQEGVSQCGSEVTAKVAVALSEGRSSVSPLAKAAGCRVVPADVGILDFPGHSGVRNIRIRNSTADIRLGPAMSREECSLAVLRGATLAEELAAAGTQLLAVGEMGIGNSTTAAAVSAAMLGLEPETVTGRGAGLGFDALMLKRQVIRDALAVNRWDPSDPLGLLAALGGLDIAAMCGAFLGAAACRIPVLIDGMISAAAALCAARLCPCARDAMLASHCSSEPAASLLLDALELQAPLSAGMHLGEGSGAVMLMPLLDMALRLYSSGQSFGRLGITAYQPLT